jgi:aerobic-type carbon monoxide dehydrogenase small subunit (CoxS/CutS family)
MPRLNAGSSHRLRFTLNGREVSGQAEPRVLLSDCLRHVIGATGTHVGCEHGVCGACTLLMDGKPIRSCITLAVAADGTEIRTVEGYQGDDLMVAIRKAFNLRHALQCGFCTSGMLATAYDVLSRIPDLDRDRIRAELGGNLCRCTGYLPIIQAIEDVHAQRSASAKLKAS